MNATHDNPLTHELRARVEAELALLPGAPLCIYVDVVRPGERIVTLFLTSETLGGLLATNRGGGWVPCWPEKPNYPCRGRWYSTAPKGQDGGAYATWQEAVGAALFPKRHFHALNEFGRDTATKRAAKLRDPLRAAALWGLIEAAFPATPCHEEVTP